MNDFLKGISLAKLPAEAADYLDQLVIWSRLADEAEKKWGMEDPDEMQDLHRDNMQVARTRCMALLDHLNDRAVLEILAHLVRAAQGRADE